eukprot:GHVP01022755.1.p1 GENE.GHVP01022755.1~~GHVP01022755.1.p1  ORF type:complete len:130 (+),score=23.16 GHVP01022755.1:142-531(+)
MKRGYITKVILDQVNGSWTMRTTTAGQNGAAKIRHVKLYPIDHGLLSGVLVDSDGDCVSSQTSDFKYCLREDTIGATLSLNNPYTGNLMLYETLRLTTEGSLVRVSQTYEESGKLEFVTVFCEKKVEEI